MLVQYAWLTSVGGMGAMLGLSRLSSIKSPFIKRKLVHFGCGTVMMLCWPLFPTNTLVNIAAASVPFLGTMQFVLVGTGIVKDPNFTKGVGVEQGKEHMMLHGPVQYGICATLLTSVAFCKPLSVIPISIMSAGDSIAALWGFHMGKKKVPWNKGKTVEGMLAFVLGSSAVTMGMLCFFERAHAPGWLSRSNIAAVIIGSLVGTLVESAPPIAGYGNLDNILLPLSSVAVCAAIGAY